MYINSLAFGVLAWVGVRFINRVDKIEKVQTVTTDIMIEWMGKHNTNHPGAEIDLKRLYDAKEGKT
jgi:hypothetical protein